MRCAVRLISFGRGDEQDEAEIHTYIHTYIGVLLVLAGCRTTEPSVPQEFSAAREEAALPTLTVEALRESIPLGNSFPIIVELEDFPPNDTITLDINNWGIIPSISEASVTSDGAGRAEVRLSGRATKAQLNMLSVRASFAEGTAANVLYVNFEPSHESDFQAQAETIIGEPVTLDEYYASLPVLDGLDALEVYGSDKPGDVIVNDVRFPEENGNLGEPMDIIVSNAGSQVGTGEPSSTAASCTRALTKVFLKSYVDGSFQPLPSSTRVYISGDMTAPSSHRTLNQTRHVGAGGALEFTAGCEKTTTFKILAWTQTGIYIHTRTIDTYPLRTWQTQVVSPSGRINTPTSLRNTTVYASTKNSASNIQLAQRVFYKVNRVHDWERTSHGLYDTFPLSVVYPDSSQIIPRSRAYYGRMYIKPADGAYDPTLFHEYGHEVYYRRMLGESAYQSSHEKAVKTGLSDFPWCYGSTGWSVWSHVDGCAGMLEGFALWFESITTRVLSNRWRDTNLFDPEVKPSISSKPAGAAVPGRVAQYLWDVTDAHALSNTNAQNLIPDTDADAVKYYNSLESVKQRYARVASHFYNAHPVENFTYMFKNRISPKLSSSQRDLYCSVVKYNTLAVTGMCDK